MRRQRLARRYALAELPEHTAGRVVGIAQALGDTLIAPITGRACVYYEVYEMRVANRNKRRAEARVLHERRGVPFLLLDGEVRAIVDPCHAEFVVDVDADTASGTFDVPSRAVLLARHRQPSAHYKTRRYEEAVIAVGETIAVFGTAVLELDPEAAPSGYRDELPRRIRLSGSQRLPLLISDNPSR